MRRQITVRSGCQNPETNRIDQVLDLYTFLFCRFDLLFLGRHVLPVLR